MAREGWLEKAPKSLGKDKFKPKWQKRYFMINKYRELIYLRKKPKNPSEKMKIAGKIKLRGAKLSLAEEKTNQPFTFKLESTIGWFLYLKADSDGECSGWMTDLADAIDDETRKEGYLFKSPQSKGKDKFRGSWKRRYFVLKQTEVFYYESRSVPEYIGKIELSGATVCDADKVTKDDFTFRVGSEGGRFLYIRSSSEVERTDWIQEFTLAIAHATASEKRRIERGYEHVEGLVFNLTREEILQLLNIREDESELSQSSITSDRSGNSSILPYERVMHKSIVRSQLNSLSPTISESDQSIREIVREIENEPPDNEKLKELTIDEMKVSQELPPFTTEEEKFTPAQHEQIEEVINQIEPHAKFESDKKRNTIVRRIPTARKGELSKLLFEEKKIQRQPQVVKRLSILRMKGLEEMISKNLKSHRNKQRDKEIQYGTIRKQTPSELFQVMGSKLKGARNRKLSDMFQEIEEEQDQDVANDEAAAKLDTLGQEFLEIVDCILSNTLESFSFDENSFFRHQDPNSLLFPDMVKNFVEVLAFNTNLTSLSCKHSYLGEMFVDEFAKCVQSGSFRNLKKLSLRGNRFSRAAVKKVLELIDFRQKDKNQLELEFLDISKQKQKYLEKSEEREIIDIVKGNKYIKELKMSLKSDIVSEWIKKFTNRNRLLSGENVKAYLTPLEEKIADLERKHVDSFIVSSDLSFEFLTKSQKLSLAQVLGASKFLKTIKLIDCVIDDIFLLKFCGSFHTSNPLESIDLTGNCLTKKGFMELTKSLKGCNAVKRLYLGDQYPPIRLNESEEMGIIENLQDCEKLVILEANLKSDKAKEAVKTLIDRNCLNSLKSWENEDYEDIVVQDIDFDESDDDKF